MFENNIEPLRTKREIAAFVKLTTRSVEKLMGRGMPHIKISSRATRFRLADVQQWLDNQFKVTRIGQATTKAGSTIRTPVANG